MDPELIRWLAATYGLGATGAIRTQPAVSPQAAVAQYSTIHDQLDTAVKGQKAAQDLKMYTQRAQRLAGNIRYEADRHPYTDMLLNMMLMQGKQR